MIFHVYILPLTPLRGINATQVGMKTKIMLHNLGAVGRMFYLWNTVIFLLFSYVDCSIPD